MASKSAKMRRVRRRKQNALMLTRSLTTIIGKSGTDTGNYRSVQLDSFAGDSDLKSLFQEYRIRKVEVTWNNLTSNATSWFPCIYVAPQHYATFLAPSNIDEVLQFENCMQLQFSPGQSTFTRTFVPYVYLDTEAGGRHFVRSPWISTTLTSVKHFIDVEWIARYSTLDPNHSISVTIKLFVDVRGTR